MQSSIWGSLYDSLPLWWDHIPYSHHNILFSISWSIRLILILSIFAKFWPQVDTLCHRFLFHIWCFSNSLMDDSIRLRIVQRTLTSTTTKWYIELPQHSFVDFNSLVIVFLTHFQLPIRYETGTNLLNSLWNNTYTHISDHIHEWRRHRRLIKDPILDQLLAEWFTKSVLPSISWDVATGGVVTGRVGY